MTVFRKIFAWNRVVLKRFFCIRGFQKIDAHESGATI